MMSTLMTLHPEKNAVYTWDDIGTAELIADLTNGSIRYCSTLDIWYKHDRNQWRKQESDLGIYDLLSSILNLLLLYIKERLWEIKQNAQEDEDEDILQAYTKYIHSCRRYGSVRALINSLKPLCEISASAFDTNPYILNTPTAAYDLRTGKEVQDVAQYNLSKSTLTSLDGDGRCERWYTFIDQIMSGDQEKASFLQRALGYSLLGVGKEECMFIAYGAKSRNGKGTLFSALEHTLGEDYIRASAPALILEKRNGDMVDFNAPQPALASLVGARIVNMSESDRDQRIHAGAMKAMTGRDTLTARGLYQAPFRFVPEFTLWLNTNHLPAVTDDTVFLSNRVWVIEFNEHFDGADRDNDLKEIFAADENRPTILRWLIDGAVDYARHGLAVPECVRVATERYRMRFDRMNSFITDCCEVEDGYKCRRADLYKAYRNWCRNDENRFSPLGSTTFYADLEQHGFPPIRREDGFYISRVRLKKEVGMTEMIKI